jgi:hypothetical protein
MPTPAPMTSPVSLDELIHGISTAYEDVLDRLAGAVLAADHLGETADHLVGHFVDQARRSGASWTEIGRSMGVTKQAAQKRFVPRSAAAREGADVGPQGFDRFTVAARNAVVAAQDAAHAAGNDEIGTAHLALGLVAAPDDRAVRALGTLGLTPEVVRGAASATLPPPAAEAPTLVPFDTAAREVLETTFREAEATGDDRVDSGHLLRALVAHEDGAGLLAELGVDTASVEAALSRVPPDDPTP